MKLSYIKALLLLVIPFSVASAYSQELQIEALKALGLENIKVINEQDESFISFEDNVCRGVNRGLREVMETLNEVDSTKRYNLLLMDEGVARVAIYSSSTAAISASFDTEALVEKLKEVKEHNSSFGKVDIMLYPELFLENSWLDKWYGVAIDLSPAVPI